MPFRLCNTTAVFQHLINDVLQDMLGWWLFVYLDHIQVYYPSEEVHMRHVRAVLEGLLGNCSVSWRSAPFTSAPLCF